jgi:hypothetical protein
MSDCGTCANESVSSGALLAEVLFVSFLHEEANKRNRQAVNRLIGLINVCCIVFLQPMDTSLVFISKEYILLHSLSRHVAATPIQF